MVKLTRRTLLAAGGTTILFGLFGQRAAQATGDNYAFSFDAIEGMRGLSEPLQHQARDEYRRNKRIQQQYLDRYGPLLALQNLEEYLDNAAALHNQDLIT
jgi:hypothetical protein